MIGPNGGVTVFPKRRYLFVDGACLDMAIERFSKKYFSEPIKAAPERLVSFLQGHFDKIFYYDALPIREDGESEEAWKARTEEKRSVLEKLEQTDRFEVFEGDVRKKGGPRDRRGQKKVDVGLAVDMLTNSFRRNMDEAGLLAGDIDFAPLLRALALEGMPVTLFHPEQTTAELKRVALLRVPLDANRLWNLIPVERLNDYPLPQPAHYPHEIILHNAMGLEAWDVGSDHWLLSDLGGLYIQRKYMADGSVWEARSRHKRSLLHFCNDLYGAQIPEAKLAVLLASP
jgi:uncharacterized LabA/DUF88 family protein